MGAIELLNYPLFNNSSLVSYYRLEGNGNDSKGSNHGTSTNVTYSSSYGKFGQGGIFSPASSSKIEVTDPSSLEFATDFSIFIWFYRTTNAAGNLRIISKGADGTEAGFGMWASDTQIFTAVQGTSARTISNAVNHLGLNTWNHAVLVRSGSSQLTYLNGVLADSITSSSGSTAGGANFLIGSLYSNNALAHSGYLDDAAIFSSAIDSANIYNYYNNVLPGKMRMLNQSVHRSNYY